MYTLLNRIYFDPYAKSWLILDKGTVKINTQLTLSSEIKY